MAVSLRSSRPGVLLLAPRPGSRRWAAIPIDARTLQPGTESLDGSFTCARDALRAAEEMLAPSEAIDPVTQFGRFMEEYLCDAESRGLQRGELLQQMQIVLDTVSHGVEAPH
jgi:hypothetical protein